MNVVRVLSGAGLAATAFTAAAGAFDMPMLLVASGGGVKVDAVLFPLLAPPRRSQ